MRRYNKIYKLGYFKLRVLIFAKMEIRESDQFNTQPPPYESYPPEQKVFRQFETQIPTFRLSSQGQKDMYQINKCDLVFAIVSSICCLACGIPALVYVFSAYKDAQEERIIEAKKKVRAGRISAGIGVVSGITILAISISLVVVYGLVYILYLSRYTATTTTT